MLFPSRHEERQTQKVYTSLACVGIASDSRAALLPIHRAGISRFRHGIAGSLLLSAVAPGAYERSRPSPIRRPATLAWTQSTPNACSPSPNAHRGGSLASFIASSSSTPCRRLPPALRTMRSSLGWPPVPGFHLLGLVPSGRIADPGQAPLLGRLAWPRPCPVETLARGVCSWIPWRHHRRGGSSSSAVAGTRVRETRRFAEPCPAAPFALAASGPFSSRTGSWSETEGSMSLHGRSTD